MIYESIINTVGKTPIIKISKFMKKYDLNNDLYVKLESKNPSGSSKDRIAVKMIETLYKNNEIKNDSIILEVSSGNTAIGLAMVCAYYDIKLIIIINEGVTVERIKLLEKYGAKVIKIKKDKNMEYSKKVATELSKRLKNIIYIDQFSNPDNYLAHFESTANEIIDDFKNDIDYIFVGMGSTGTIMGISKKIKKINDKIKIIGIEPEDCSYYKNNNIGVSDIPGIGTTFIPYIYNKKYIDDIVLVKKEDSLKTMNDLMRLEGINVGISSGAALCGSLQYIENNNIKTKKILVICPDSIDKYLSIV